MLIHGYLEPCSLIFRHMGISSSFLLLSYSLVCLWSISLLYRISILGNVSSFPLPLSMWSVLVKTQCILGNKVYSVFATCVILQIAYSVKFANHSVQILHILTDYFAWFFDQLLREMLKLMDMIQFSLFPFVLVSIGIKFKVLLVGACILELIIKLLAL